MEISSQEREIPTQIQIPIPINSSYGGGGHGHGGHMNILHDPAPQNHIIPTSAPQIQIPSNAPTVPTSLEDNVVPYKKMVRYRECLKNHAASMGGNATDGCGEFMPSGVEGTLEALICSACNCHRNFHRKEVEGEVPYNSSSCECHFGPSSHLNNNNRASNGRKLILGHHKGMLGPETLGYPTGTLIHSRPAHHQMMMSYNLGSMPSESDEQEGGGGYGGGGGGGLVGRPLPPPHLVKKRFRTKFSQEQKEKMLSFAEKVGWKIQKQEENVVQNFCQEIGVKRRVLKVWMHNNKHNLAKKINSSSSEQNPI
ncbi:hypothetical protein RHSIM_Rhsim11G0117600 [Rhododendron simsii]|uniref:ZF-HD dimerization-type domain-containing protein n=1 Tax=Rhododendron simsii TaxID=118357 RepID=A0A834LAY9_RHOSS|nr:hypothetical protein RHSIM_Rhsim11G0117600 [Rhododendron simsii]